MSHFHITQSEYSEKLRHLSYVTIATVSFLIAIKLVAYSYTGSIILLSVAADSVFDLIISLTNFILVRISLKKSTSTYRYGYGKAEALSAFIEGIIIFIISVLILAIAVQKYINPESSMPHTNLALGVMAISLITTFFLVRYQSKIMRQTDSISVESEKLHYISDLLTNFAALIGIILVSNFNILTADPIIDGLISIYLIYTTIKIFQKSVAVLIDKEIDDELKKEIFDIVQGHNKVLGFHDVRTRQSGSSKGKFFLQMHIEVSEHVSLGESHNIADQVEDKILEKFPDAELILHVDPSNIIEKKEFADD
jgi:ferrous-iron efflux pump FieF